LRKVALARIDGTRFRCLARVAATARFLQQMVQRLQQHALRARAGRVTGRHVAESARGRGRLAGLQPAT